MKNIICCLYIRVLFFTNPFSDLSTEAQQIGNTRKFVFDKDTAAVKLILDNIIEQFISANKNIPSIILLVETPNFKWKGAVGYSNPAKGIKAAPDDLFYIASTAKPMTAAIILKLFEENKLDLDDKISVHLPDEIMSRLHILNNHDYSDSITIRQLLNHTSGIGDNWSNSNFLISVLTDTSKFWKPEETIEFVKNNVPPLSIPGKEFHYSDINYNLLGLIIEKVEEEKLTAVFRKYLFDPLAMQNTYRPFYENPDLLKISNTKSVSLLGDIDYSSFRSMTADWAGGGLVSNMEDMNKFIRALFNGKIFNNKNTLNEMQRWLNINKTMNYGLGLAMDNLDNEEENGITGELIGHTGASGAFMFYWKEKEISICGTINQVADETKIGDLISKILMALK
ncbi:MAG: serine hydrolase domain-containing protein [bacterium]